MTPWQKFREDWSGKKVLIMGLGLQGRGVGDTQTFVQAGAQVTVTDLKSADQLQASLEKIKNLPVRLILDGHRPQDFVNVDLILRNPDAPQHHPLLTQAAASGIPISMDSSLFAHYCSLPIIGITGSRGKTTTTMMIYQLLSKLQPQPVFLGGNIPDQATLALLPELPETHGFIVLELSSWELQGWEAAKISPPIAIFTNFSQDHLNRYDSLADYFHDKVVITRYQKPADWLVVNQDNPWSQKLVSQTQAQIRWFSSANLPSQLKLAIPGNHNRANAAAALTVADILGLPPSPAINLLNHFSGVPFRLETIAQIQGINFVNDTTATTPTAAIVALEAITAPIILIAGGADKNLDFEALGKTITAKVKQVLLLTGSATAKLTQAIVRSGGKPLILGRFDDLSTAIDQAFRQAQPGDTILLSPGCTSFGMFVNEFDRGQKFNQLVKQLQLDHEN